jgi:hypothetical protein
MTTLPTIENWGKYTNNNYGFNTRLVKTGNINLYYSYDTIVAYYDNVDGLVVSKNKWGVTTGKHLNWIDGGNKQARKDYATFSAMLAAARERHGL